MLQLQSISKSFSQTKALDNLSLRFHPGEIHALVGENGAGKSTAMKIITGIHQPDAGQILYQDKPLHLRSYRDSLRIGIDIVHQEIQVVPHASVAENIMLDKLITRGNTGIIDWKQVRAVARRYMDRVGLNVDPAAPIGCLSAAQKQLAQIAKALAADARVLLLDEPTSSLTQHEAANLFKILRDLKTSGRTIIFASHRFDEVLSLSDRVTVLRDGRHVATRPTSELNIPTLIHLMLGRDSKAQRLGTLTVNRQCEVLRADHLFLRNKTHDTSFTLYEGEILGFYGLIGSGRTELARILIGQDQPQSGSIHIRGQKAVLRNPSDTFHRYRIGYITENRKEEGLLLKSSIQTNITIAVWPKLIHWLTRRINPRRERDIAQKMVRDLDIRAAGLNQRTDQLSGGNQQKVSFAKWLAADCDILIIDEPTVGVDVGAKDQIHQLIWNLAKNQRKSIILISSDLPEIIKLATRILIFRDRRIIGEISEVNENNLTYEQAAAAIGQYLA